MDRGMIYISSLNTNDVNLFTSISSLTMVQKDILQDEVMDNTVVEIYSKDFEEDLEGTSMLISVSLDGSKHDNNIVNAFNDILNSEEIVIKELPNGSYILGINIGCVTNEETINKMKDLIRRTTNVSNLEYFVDDVFNVLPTSGEAASANVITSNSIAVNPMNVVVKETPVANNNIVDEVYKLIMQKFIEEGGENAFVNMIVDRVILKLDKSQLITKEEIKEKIETTIGETTTDTLADTIVIEEDMPIQTEEEPKLEEPKSLDNILKDYMTGTFSDLPTIPVEEEPELEPVDDNFEEPTTEETTIYNELSKLAEGVENDNELFKEVLKNKSKMSVDELENICTFNMYNYLTTGEMTPLTQREKVYRKNRI